jgi:hypothetical protein
MQGTMLLKLFSLMGIVALNAEASLLINAHANLARELSMLKGVNRIEGKGKGAPGMLMQNLSSCFLLHLLFITRSRSRILTHYQPRASLGKNKTRHRNEPAPLSRNAYLPMFTHYIQRLLSTSFFFGGL